MKIKAILFIVLIGILLTTPIHAFAQSALSDDFSDLLPEMQITDNRAVFSFADLGLAEKSLFSPFGVSRILFSVPPNWKLTSGGTVTINFEAVLNGANFNSLSDGGSVGANFLVRFNEVVVGTVPVNATGSYSVQLSIPDEALVSKREDGRHILSIVFDAQLSCTYNLNAVITLKSSSSFDLLYESTSPELSLSRLPAPFYLENSLVPDSTLVVLPDSPAPEELQAAMNVIAGLGSMISNDYNVRLASAGEVTDSDLSVNHLIFVGLPEKLSILSGIKFTHPIENGGFVGVPAASADDGILQMALSPWNPTKAVLLVSGNSTDALLKAAQAASSSGIFVYEDPTIAYVSNVQSLPDALPFVENFSLEDLGYSTKTSGLLTGTGSTSTTFSFYVTRDQVFTTEGFVDLAYYHSGLLDYGSSSFSLYLNDQVFFTNVFKEESEKLTNLQIPIPPGILRYGENKLEVRASMLELPSCDSTVISDPWFTISDQTRINLPIAQSRNPSQSILRDLKFFPELYTTTSDLGDVAFVVSSDPSTWKTAGLLAYTLGSTVQPAMSNLKVYYGDNIPDEVRADRSMIVVGKASDLPFVSELNDQLPAPFDLATNTASERQLQISYRIPEGQNVGYLELLPSPFNAERTILLVSGNSDVGVGISGTVLTLSDLQDRLAGIFAVTNGEFIATGNASSVFSIVGEGVPGAEQVITTPIPAPSQAASVPIPVWLVPFMIISLLLVTTIVVYIVFSFIKKERLRRVHEKIVSEEAEKIE